MQAARDEIAHWAEFDHLLVNDDLETCIDDVVTVLRAARSTVERSTGLAALAQSMCGVATGV
jgi:guanylate kinase